MIVGIIKGDFTGDGVGEGGGDRYRGFGNRWRKGFGWKVGNFEELGLGFGARWVGLGLDGSVIVGRFLFRVVVKGI